VTDTDAQREFWSGVAREYDRVVDLQIGPATRGLLRERLCREGRLGRVVELGCGTGFFSAVLAQKSDSLVATDLSPGMLELARANVRAPNASFQVENCESTSFPDASFDAAFAALVLHFTEPARALAELRRILRPAGTLLLANLDPKALTGLDRVRCLARILYRGITGYRRRPPARLGRNVLSEPELRDLLAAGGFKVTVCDTIRDASRSSYIPIEYVSARRD
jgi:ubiquinone/menaquinone biosynthesis C-methylase UbiE